MGWEEGKGREMTQTLYAYMNKRYISKKSGITFHSQR
jgi:hypothetical protein